MTILLILRHNFCKKIQFVCLMINFRGKTNNCAQNENILDKKISSNEVKIIKSIKIQAGLNFDSL